MTEPQCCITPRRRGKHSRSAINPQVQLARSQHRDQAPHELILRWRVAFARTFNKKIAQHYPCKAHSLPTKYPNQKATAQQQRCHESPKRLRQMTRATKCARPHLQRTPPLLLAAQSHMP